MITSVDLSLEEQINQLEKFPSIKSVELEGEEVTVEFNTLKWENKNYTGSGFHGFNKLKGKHVKFELPGVKLKINMSAHSKDYQPIKLLDYDKRKSPLFPSIKFFGAPGVYTDIYSTGEPHFCWGGPHTQEVPRLIREKDLLGLVSLVKHFLTENNSSGCDAWIVQE